MTKIKRPRIRAWTDGAYTKGIASYGLIVKYEDKILLSTCDVVGDGCGMSNNVAEYCGLIAFIKWFVNNRESLAKQGMLQERPVVYSDSQLMVNQMTGYYSIHGGLYLPYYKEATTLMGINKVDFSFWWIPREENTEADDLSKEALKINRRD